MGGNHYRVPQDIFKFFGFPFNRCSDIFDLFFWVF